MNTTAPIPGATLARLALVVYALALTTGTHWPRLQLGTEAVPAPDKLVHWAAFGGLTLLLWASGLAATRPLVFATIALVWPMIDELTQAIPGLGRHISWLDLLASELGVVTVLAWRWATRPIGGPASRARIVLDRRAWRMTLASPRAWLPIGAAATLGGGLVGLVTAAATEVDPVNVMAAALMGALLAALGVAEGVRRRRRALLADIHACHRCGASCRDEPATDRGRVRCPSCDATQWLGQWRPLALGRSRLLRLLAPALLLGVGIYALIAAAYSIAVALHVQVPAIGRLNRLYHGLTLDMRVVVDLTLIMVVAAIAAMKFRARLARAIDGQDRTCLSCGHDLRGIAGREPVGTCSECGRTFVRTPERS